MECGINPCKSWKSGSEFLVIYVIVSYMYSNESVSSTENEAGDECMTEWRCGKVEHAKVILFPIFQLTVVWSVWGTDGRSRERRRQEGLWHSENTLCYTHRERDQKPHNSVLFRIGTWSRDFMAIYTCNRAKRRWNWHAQNCQIRIKSQTSRSDPPALPIELSVSDKIENYVFSSISVTECTMNQVLGKTKKETLSVAKWCFCCGKERQIDNSVCPPHCSAILSYFWT